MEDVTPLHKHCTLKTSVMRPRCTVRWMQQGIAPWCLFDSFTREADYSDVVLGHLLLETTSKGFSKKEVLLDC